MIILPILKSAKSIHPPEFYIVGPSYAEIGECRTLVRTAMDSYNGNPDIREIMNTISLPDGCHIATSAEEFVIHGES